MATSTHKINALREGSQDHEDWDVEYTITFKFWPAERTTWNHPGADPGIEFVSAVRDRGTDPLTASEREWCAQWLEEAYDAAVQVATDDRLADEDDHADFLRRSRIEDKITRDL